MNSQIVLINQALKSKRTFVILTSFIPISLYLKAGFVSVSVIWFFAMCLYNYDSSIKRQFKTYYILLFPVALFAFYFLWIFFSDDFATAVDLILRKVHLLLIPLGFIIVNKKISDKELHIFLIIFLAAFLLCSFVCFANAVYNVIAFKSLTPLIDGEFYYFTYFKLTEPVNIPPIYLSMYGNFSLLVVLKTPFVRNPILKTLIALYIGLFIVMISSTIGIICLVIMMGLQLLTTVYKRQFSYILAGLFLMILFIGLYKFSFNRESFATLFKADYKEQQYGDLLNSTSSRLAIWSSAFETIKKKPIVGYGPGDGQKALEKAYEKNDFVWGLRESLNPHNEFLSTILDLGMGGFSLLAVMLMLPLIQAIKSKDMLAICFVVMIVLFFCMESVLVRQKGIVFFSFFYSLTVRHLATSKSEFIQQVIEATTKN